ncbi:hypothetical protein BDV37DRAFT_289182 [Aspergillus pseudonomiae]|uniref:peptidylprolyl isomerase n=1 Tax=Aspergillus pseudonomiae TaxID=1506151 RepID=A0A5N7CU47_9EURO|nr:uncharacterized protein BDV37DRAFT_289182 [Aspergillus pseudonomiae]KAE8397726.1 hypothetical protein BDV37DRAFT_289182 [Aspergillus pseudonomiae]
MRSPLGMQLLSWFLRRRHRSICLSKTSPEPLPILLIGGAVLDPGELEGASNLIKPLFFDVANAVGAACAKVGGTVDKTTSIASQFIKDAVEETKKAAIERAIQTGAVEDSVSILRRLGPCLFISNHLGTVVKTIRSLDTERSMSMFVGSDDGPVDEVDHLTYRPKVVFNEKAGRHKCLRTETDLNYIADAGRIQLQEMLHRGYKIRCIDQSVLPDETLLVYQLARKWCGWKGIAMLNTPPKPSLLKSEDPSPPRSSSEARSLESSKHYNKGHSYGEIIITEVPAEDDDLATNQNCSPTATQGGHIRIPFKNDSIYAEHHAIDGSKKIIASNKEVGKPIGVSEYRYGYQVVVLDLACSPHLSKVETDLEVGGPKGYGYDITYEPLGDIIRHLSTIIMVETGLPAGWEVRHSNSKNLPYYFSLATKQSRWEPPSGTDTEKLKAYMTDYHSGPTSRPDGTGQGEGKIRCSHLLVKHSESRRSRSWIEAEITRSKEEAIEILRGHEMRIKSGDVNLEDLAMSESDCSSARNGGDLYVPSFSFREFEDAAFTLQPGRVSGIVDTASGVHLIER